jgi:hypothetical protein
VHPTPPIPPTPDDPPDPPPSRPRPSGDPLAAGLGNAFLPGVGYALLGRWRLAVGALCLTVVLLAVLASDTRATWLYVAALIWCAALTTHGWHLARRSRRDPAGGGTASRRRKLTQRSIALVAACLVTLSLLSLRADASGIEDDAAEAHRAGDCERALSLLDGLSAGHRLTDPRLVERSEASVEACELLVRAEAQATYDRLAAAETLDTYASHPEAIWEGVPGRRADLVLAEATEEFDDALTGNLDSLSTGFEHLAAVLGEFPGRQDAVEEVMDGFLDALPTGDACDTRSITDWLDGRPASGDVLDRAADAVPRVAPAAIVGCADEAIEDQDWGLARDRYRQLLDRYPGHDLADQARAGVERAETEIELINLRELLRPESSGEQPPYCDNPAPYRGAEPYEGGGPHRAMHFGHPGHKKPLPDSWLTRDAADAVLVICAGERRHGAAVETCSYEMDRYPGYKDVTFYNQEFPVRVYEVRTGRLVHDTPIQIGGASCPGTIFYEYYGSIDPGPPSSKYVSSSSSDVRAAYESLINP